jgi:Purple acid Phosphatase, N-terminal domain
MRRATYVLAIITTIGFMAVVVTNRSQAQQPAALKIIDGPRVEGVGDSWAMIAWTTNTGGSSIVRYGTDPNRLDHTAQAPYADNESTTYQVHRVQLKNLQPGTRYSFVVDSGQGEGTGTEAKSAMAQFTTKAGGATARGDVEALRITDGPRVEATGDSWAMIAWTTNTGGSSIVRYGTNPNHLDHTAQAPYADNESTTYQVHRVQVKNLRPGTTYYFAVDSGQGEGTGTETKSPIAQFTTKTGSGR